MIPTEQQSSVKALEHPTYRMILEIQEMIVKAQLVTLQQMGEQRPPYMEVTDINKARKP